MFDLPRDVAVLCACSLVCSSWLPIAREHLYSTIHILDAEPAKEKTLSHFVRLLELAPSVGYAVTRVVVIGSFTGSKLPIHDLFSTLTQLPRLRHLHLHHWRISHFASLDLPQRLPLTLQTLELKSIGFFLDAPLNIFRLFNLFPPGCSLTLDKVSFRYVYGSPYLDIVPTLPLPTGLAPSSLTLHYADDRALLLLEAFARTSLPSALKQLYISFYDFTPLLPSLARFIKKCDLQSLTFDLTSCLPYAFWSSKLRLEEASHAVEVHLAPAFQKMTALDEFTLHVGAIPLENAAFWGLCADIVLSLPTTLRALHIFAADEHPGPDVSRLRRALQRFRNLEISEIPGLPTNAWEAELSPGTS